MTALQDARPCRVPDRLTNHPRLIDDSSSSSSTGDAVLERADAAAAADASQASQECLAAAAALKVDGLKWPPLKAVPERQDRGYRGCAVPEHRRMRDLQSVAKVLTTAYSTAAGQQPQLSQPQASAAEQTAEQPERQQLKQQPKQQQRQRQQQPWHQLRKERCRQQQLKLREQLLMQRQRQLWQRQQVQMRLRAAMQAKATLPSDVKLAISSRLALQWRRELARVLLQQQLRQLLQGRRQQQQQEQQQEQQEQPAAGDGVLRQQEQSGDSAQQQLARRWQGPKHRSPVMLQAAEDSTEQAQAATAAAEDSTEQDSTAEDFTAEDSAEQDSAAEDSEEQDSAAEDSAAEDFTEQESAAEESATEGQEHPTGQGDEAPDSVRRAASVFATTQPVAFLGRAATPGVLLNALQRHFDVLSAQQCSQAFARLAELCRVNPQLLQHQYTQQLLSGLQAELPRLQQQQQLQPRQLAVIAAASRQLRQPQLLRCTLLQLLRHPEARDPKQLLAGVVACAHMQQMRLAKVLLRLLLSDDSMLAPLPANFLRTAAHLAEPAGKQLPAKKQLELLSTLLQAVDTSSVQQLAVGLWVAVCIMPDCQSAARSLFDSFLQLRSQATPLAVVLALSCFAALKLQPTPYVKVRKLLQAFKRQLPEISGHSLAAQLVSSTLVAAVRVGYELSAEQVQLFVDAFVEQAPSATATQLCDVCWAVSQSSQGLRYAQLRPLLARFMQLLPTAGAGHIKSFMASVTVMKLALPRDECQQLVTAVLDKVPAHRRLAAADMFRQVLQAAAAARLLLPTEQLRQFEQVWVQLWPNADVEQCRTVFTGLSVFAQLNYFPRELADMVHNRKHCGGQTPRERLHEASMQSLYNAAVAFAIFPAKKWCKLRFARAAAARLESDGVPSAGVAVATGVCWAVAMGDLRQLDLIRCVKSFAAACSKLWDTVGLRERQKQLYVHTWLEQVDGHGLAGHLTEQQLADCGTAWQVQRHGPPAPSEPQQQVYDLLLQLPADTWQQQGGPVLEQLTEDGVFSIDIAATRADGVRLAIEFDGPRHFMLPRNDLNGPTLSRNRLLEGKGLKVVSIPYFEWEEVPAGEQLAYL